MQTMLGKYTERTARQELAKVSSYAADRVDLVQAGGGNASVKTTGGRLHIKASGSRLRDAVSGRGVAVVDMEGLPSPGGPSNGNPEIFRRWSQDRRTPVSGPRPSMELALHAPLGPVVLHIHPVSANAFLCLEEARTWMERVFNDKLAYLYLPYAMPGADLGTLLWNALETGEGATEPQVVFLENHGLVLHGECADDVIRLNEQVLSLLGDHLPRQGTIRPFEPLPPECCVATATLDAIRAAVPNREDLVAFRAPFERRPVFDEERDILFPDAAVYCGAGGVRIEEEGCDSIALRASKFARLWGHTPRMWRIGDVVIASGSTPDHALGVAEVGWAHEMVDSLAQELGRVHPLSNHQVCALLGCEDEIYRQAIAERSNETP